MKTGRKTRPGTLTIALVSAGLAVASTACGGGRGPILTYRETESPLRYRYATEGETSYTGSARFAGDTTWNGIAARVIVSKETIRADGNGFPEGAPGEVELSVDGTASATYLWDPGSGMLLAMKAESRSEGRVFTLGFDLPIEIRSERRAELVR
jgi:hypothetical protein